MPTNPDDLQVAFERAEMMEKAASANMEDSYERYKAKPTEANRVILRADLEALRGSQFVRRDAEDLVISHMNYTLEQTAFFERHRVDRIADAAHWQKLIEMLDELGKLRDAIEPPSEGEPS